MENHDFVDEVNESVCEVPTVPVEENFVEQIIVNLEDFLADGNREVLGKKSHYAEEHFKLYQLVGRLTREIESFREKKISQIMRNGNILRKRSKYFR